MATTDDHRLAGLIAKLRALAPLDDDDVAAIAALPAREQTDRAGAYLVREGARVTECCLLLSGYACRNKLTGDGRRQIVSFHIPGEVLDLQHLLLDRADHNLELITEGKVAWIPVDALRALARDRVAVAAALWRDTLIDASIFREWVLNVGQRDGRARVAHMLCEFAFRRAAAGLGEVEGMDLPMTQAQIADATGMTPIHVNRMLGSLRAEGVLSSRNRKIEITDWPAIQRVAEFDSAYLHMAAAR